MRVGDILFQRQNPDKRASRVLVVGGFPTLLFGVSSSYFYVRMHLFKRQNIVEENNV